MKLLDFGLLTDQNIHPLVVSFLRAAGFDVLDVKEQGWHGSDDEVLLRRAVADHRLVVTHDPDFGTLAVQAGRPVIGIIYLRPGHVDAHFTNGTIQSVLNANPDVMPPFILVAKRAGKSVSIRIRQL